MKHVGVCALCQLDGELCKSHLWLPRFVYKRLQDPNAPNVNPVQISSKGVQQTSFQEKKPLLCKMCENDRFNKLGEHWTSQVCLQDNNITFPLLDLLRVAPHHILDADNAAFYTAVVPGFKHAALEYFAASMVWRGQFIDNDIQPNSYLLKNYEPQFKSYLLGQASFPADASLFLFVRYRSPFTQLSRGVSATRARMAGMYSFSIPGITFQLTVGKDRDRRLDDASFNINPRRPILDMSAIDVANSESMIAVLEQARLHGRRWKLASKAIQPS